MSRSVQAARRLNSALTQLQRGLAYGVGLERPGAAGSDTKIAGKTFMVTGATSGLGRHTADLLAQQGAIVLIHGRSLTRVKRAIRELRGGMRRPVYGYCYDFASLAQVAEFAAHVKRDIDKLGGGIDVLINNAGVFEEDHQISVDGLERTWAVNVAAPFLLTAELLPLVRERILNVSSISMSDRLDWNNLQSEKGYEREGHASYGTSKLALNMWSYLLAERLRKAGSPVSVVTVDPGTVGTKILISGWGEIAAEVAMRAEEADDEFWAATTPGLASGGYYVNRHARRSSTFSYDHAAQEQLWRVLEQQTGVQYRFS